MVDVSNLSYATLVVPLTKAVQELKAENDMLRRRVDALERRFGEPAVINLKQVEVRQ